MSDRDDAGSETGFRRLIREAKEEAFHARRQLRRDQLRGDQPGPGVQAKLDAAVALADYRDVLYDYHDEGALKTPWGEREVDVDALDRYLSETTVQEKELNRRGEASEPVTVPKVADISTEYLFRAGKELDAIAKELGFAASAHTPTPHTETSEKDLIGLLSARGQEQALENLPKSWRGDA